LESNSTPHPLFSKKRSREVKAKKYYKKKFRKKNIHLALSRIGGNNKGELGRTYY